MLMSLMGYYDLFLVELIILPSSFWMDSNSVVKASEAG